MHVINKCVIFFLKGVSVVLVLFPAVEISYVKQLLLWSLKGGLFLIFEYTFLYS